MDSILIIVVAALIFFFVFLRMRTWKISLRTMGLGIVGTVLGIVVTGVLIYINCVQHPDPFCSVGPAVLLGPFLMLGGATIGIVIDSIRNRKHAAVVNKLKKPSRRGYGYALLAATWVTLVYFWFSQDAQNVGHNVVFSWL